MQTICRARPLKSPTTVPTSILKASNHAQTYIILLVGTVYHMEAGKPAQSYSGRECPRRTHLLHSRSRPYLSGPTDGGAPCHGRPTPDRGQFLAFPLLPRTRDRGDVLEREPQTRFDL